MICFRKSSFISAFFIIIISRFSNPTSSSSTSIGRIIGVSSTVSSAVGNSAGLVRHEVSQPEKQGLYTDITIE